MGAGQGLGVAPAVCLLAGHSVASAKGAVSARINTGEASVVEKGIQAGAKRPDDMSRTVAFAGVLIELGRLV